MSYQSIHQYPTLTTTANQRDWMELQPSTNHYIILRAMADGEPWWLYKLWNHFKDSTYPRHFSTLYRAFPIMLDNGLIEAKDAEPGSAGGNERKPYVITAKGRQLLIQFADYLSGVE